MKYTSTNYPNTQKQRIGFMSRLFDDKATTKTGRKLELLYSVMVVGGAESYEKAKALSIRRSYLTGNRLTKEDIGLMNEFWHAYKWAKRKLT